MMLSKTACDFSASCSAIEPEIFQAFIQFPQPSRIAADSLTGSGKQTVFTRALRLVSISAVTYYKFQKVLMRRYRPGISLALLALLTLALAGTHPKTTHGEPRYMFLTVTDFEAGISYRQAQWHAISSVRSR